MTETQVTATPASDRSELVPSGQAQALAVTFSYDPPVGPSQIAVWQRQLEEVAPYSEKVSWLKLIWDPGTLAHPIQRWIIYEMTPRDFIPEMIRDELEGPSLDQDKDALMTRIAWRLYRETGCYGVPAWVVQGTHGGHKRWFTHEEARLLEAMGRLPFPPEPGALCYAEPDRRCREKLAEMDKLYRGFGELGLAKIEEFRKAREIELNTRLLKWLDEQMEEVVDSTQWDSAALPRTDTDPVGDLDMHRERFIKGE